MTIAGKQGGTSEILLPLFSNERGGDLLILEYVAADTFNHVLGALAEQVLHPRVSITRYIPLYVHESNPCRELPHT